MQKIGKKSPGVTLFQPKSSAENVIPEITASQTSQLGLRFLLSLSQNKFRD